MQITHDHRSTNHHPIAKAPLVPNSRELIYIYALMISAWMFDFRADGAAQGLAFQAIYMSIYLACIFLFFIIVKFHKPAVRRQRQFILVVMLFILIGCITGIIRGQSVYSLLRNSFGSFIYLSAAIVTARMVFICTGRSLRKILGWLCLGFTFSSFLIVSLFQGGVDISTVRYQIIGTSTIAALGLAVAALAHPLTRIEKLTALSSAGILFLSVTRTFLLVPIAQAFYYLPIIKNLNRFRLTVAAISTSALISIVLFLNGEILDRWYQRIFVMNQFSGIDPTLLARQSEWGFMWSTFISSVDRLLFGSGMAAETSYFLSQELGGAGASSSTGFGHNQHLSLLFIGGLLGGLPLLAFQLRLFLHAISFGKKSSSARLHPDTAFLGTWGALIVIGSFSTDFISTTLYSRGFALWYGIGTGLLLGVSSMYFYNERTLQHLIRADTRTS